MNLFPLPSFQFKKDISNFLISFLSWHGRHGQGKYTLPDGTSYEGNWKNNKQHGQGTLTCSNGSVYEGEWVDGKRHGQGTLTWPDGTSYEGEWVDDKQHGRGTLTEKGITVNGTYENDICTDFLEVKIQTEHRFFRQYNGDNGVLCYQKGEEKPQPVSTGNKRLPDILKQLGTAKINIKPDDNISCENAKEFEQKIEHLKKLSTKENTPIIKAFTIPDHGFVMIFQKGEAYCYDNGTIEQDDSYEEYNKELESKEVKYEKISILKRLDFSLIDGSPIKIEMPQNSLVCRHLAYIIYQKMQEFIKNGADPIGEFKEYCEKVAGEKQSPKPIVRCNSFEQPANNVKIDCCTQSL